MHAFTSKPMLFAVGLISMSTMDSFVESGLLMPRFLSSMNIKDVSNLLREFHMKDEVINKLCSFSELLRTLSKNIHLRTYSVLVMRI